MCGKTLKRRGKGWRQRLVTLAVENNWSQGLERGGLGGGGSVSSGRGDVKGGGDLARRRLCRCRRTLFLANYGADFKARAEIPLLFSMITRDWRAALVN